MRGTQARNTSKLMHSAIMTDKQIFINFTVCPNHPSIFTNDSLNNAQLQNEPW